MRQPEALWLAACLALAGCASGGGPQARGKASPNAEAVRLNLGLAQGYMQRGEYQVALERLQKAESLDPRSAEVQTLLGFLYEQIRRPEQAAEHYRRSIELAPEDGIVLNNYGAWLCRSGRTAEADTWFVKALEDPFYRTPAAALANAGMCARQAGEPGKAEQYFRRVLALDPNDAVALENLAGLSLEQGNLLSARAFWQRREALPIQDPALLELGARIEAALGNRDAANRYRERLSQEFPDYRPPTPNP